ncbi:MAG: Rrf2 family transcriptional regulator [Acidobacteria bacterium]|nr:Rrf2 family transcriptional regulator [Acidobacteriota bacterium]
MRTLSKKTQYTLRALYNLSDKHGGALATIGDIAREESIPKKFLEQILLTLKRDGFVESRPGRQGGYLLARPPRAITLGQVIRSIEGPLAPLPCASESRFRKCDECVDIQTCGTRMVMREVRDAMAHILDSTTLEAVCRRQKEARAVAGDQETLMYYI